MNGHRDGANERKSGQVRDERGKIGEERHAG
jgi:hypothetical protein